MYVKTEWKDEVVEFPYRYSLEDVAGEDSQKDMIPAGGDVVQEGTPINADNLNHMEEGIYQATENGTGKTFSGTYDTKAALLSDIDDEMTDAGDGVRLSAYLTGAQSNLLGLGNTPHYIVMLPESSNTRILVAVNQDGSSVGILAKVNGTWGNAPKMISISNPLSLNEDGRLVYTYTE